jgi:hypothetical protein
MGQIVTMGALLQCMFGVAPTPLTVTPLGPPVTAGGAPVATIQDFKPFVNIIPFGICNSPSNPAAVSAKAAGATAPCTPTTTSPWVPGSPTVMVNNQPALNATSRLVCALGASPCISVVSPGSAPTVQVP